MENAPQPAPAKPLHDPFGVRDIGLRKLLQIPVKRTHEHITKKLRIATRNIDEHAMIGY
jgi:hypothetical protein